MGNGMKTRFARQLLATIAFALTPIGLPLPTVADVVRLTNGKVLHGKIVRENERQIVLEIGSQYTISVPRERIASLDRESPLMTHLRTARDHLDAGRFGHAAAAYRRALKLDPDSGVARDGLRESLFRFATKLLDLKRYDECRDVIERCRALSPDDKRLDRLATLIESAARSVADLEKKAETLLAVNRFDEATRLFDRARKIMPERKEHFDHRLAVALAGRADVLFKTGKLPGAVDEYRRALRLDPGIDRSHVARYLAARVVLMNDRIEKARGRLTRDGLMAMAAELRSLVELKPDSVHANYLLGVVRRGLGDAAGARAAFVTSLGADAPRRATLDELHNAAMAKARAQEINLSTEKERALWNVAEDEPRVQRLNENFVVRHRNGAIARRVALAADYHTKRLYALYTGQQIGAVFDPPCRIELYVEGREFQKAEGQPSWSPACAKSKMGRDGKPILMWATYQKAPELVSSVIPHEMSHLVLRRVLPGLDVPLWIDEGLAIAQEPEYKKQYLLSGMLNAARMGKALPFETLLALDDYPHPGLIHTYYAQSMLATEVLLERGGYDRLFKLVGRVQEGRLKDALADLYGLSINGFKALWAERVADAERRIGNSPLRHAE